MPLAPCRECGAQVSTQAFSCPHCGAPRPTDAAWTGSGYEWKSSSTVWGYPLVHVAFGRDARGKRRVAKGVIAVGQFALGLITVAQFGIGLLLGVGQFMAGLLVLGQFAGAVAVGVGQLATGYVAVGQVILACHGVGQIDLTPYLRQALQFLGPWWREWQTYFR